MRAWTLLAVVLAALAVTAAAAGVQDAPSAHAHAAVIRSSNKGLRLLGHGVVGRNLADEDEGDGDDPPEVPNCANGSPPEPGYDCQGRPLDTSPQPLDEGGIVLILVVVAALAIIGLTVAGVVYCACKSQHGAPVYTTGHSTQGGAMSKTMSQNSGRRAVPVTVAVPVAPGMDDTWVRHASEQRRAVGADTLTTQYTPPGAGGAAGSAIAGLSPVAADMTKIGVSPAHQGQGHRHSVQRAQAVAHNAFVDGGVTELTLTQVSTVTANFCQKIGGGSFGDVYAGTLCGADVAVKRFRAVEGGLPKDWFVEAQTLSRLRHPRILPLIALCTNAAAPALVYPLMHGGSLDRHIKASRASLASGTGPSTLTVVVRIRVLRQVAEGLVVLHDRGRCHRDVKPGNVLLDKDMQACVADVGLVRPLNGNGTITLAPTEQGPSPTHATTALAGTPG